MAAAYSEPEIRARLSDLPGWALEGGELVRTLEFPTFPAGIQFVNRVAEEAEKAQHHPDIDIRYTRIRLALVSHDAGGITDRDFGMAKTINGLV